MVFLSGRSKQPLKVETRVRTPLGLPGRGHIGVSKPRSVALELVDDFLIPAEDLRVGVTHQLDYHRVRHATSEQERRRSMP